jgi:predicted nucleotidyltransferase
LLVIIGVDVRNSVPASTLLRAVSNNELQISQLDIATAPRAERRSGKRLASLRTRAYLCFMDRNKAMSLLRAHEAELKSAGVDGLSIFGSVARGEATDNSDVDLLVELSPQASEGGFAYFGRLDDLAKRLSAILGCDVDVVAEPVRKARLRREIEREAARAF